MFSWKGSGVSKLLSIALLATLSLVLPDVTQASPADPRLRSVYCEAFKDAFGETSVLEAKYACNVMTEEIYVAGHTPCRGIRDFAARDACYDRNRDNADRNREICQDAFLFCLPMGDRRALPDFLPTPSGPRQWPSPGPTTGAGLKCEEGQRLVYRELSNGWLQGVCIPNGNCVPYPYLLAGYTRDQMRDRGLWCPRRPIAGPASVLDPYLGPGNYFDSTGEVQIP